MKRQKMIVQALWYTHIKGTAGHWVTGKDGRADVDEQGIVNDRQRLVTDENGMFVAQRQGSVTIPLVGAINIPSSCGGGIAIRSMCLITSRIENSELIVNAPGMPTLHLPEGKFSGPVEDVQVWSNASLSSVYQGDEAAEWFTEFLSRERKGRYRFYRMAKTCRRTSKGGDAILGFQDAFPFMILSQNSLDNLNALLNYRGKEQVPMDRFRPNIILAGGENPHFEDNLGRIKIGEVILEGKTLCDRCITPCIDQKTGALGKEPLATLATYRTGLHLGSDGIRIKKGKDNKVFFGRNFDHHTTGTIRVGDEVEVERLD